MEAFIDIATGFRVSRIITGLWQIADIERKEGPLDVATSASHLSNYVASGFTTFDMADHYGSSELIAGHFRNHHAHGDRTQLLTKWVPPPGKISRESVREAVQASLARMQSQMIDLMQFHAWRYADPSWLDGLFYLDELRQEGLIRFLGVTNFDAVHLKMALDSGIPIVSNQVCHSLIDRRANADLRRVCQDYPVNLLAFGTLAGGFLTDKWHKQKEPANDDLTTWSEMKYKRFIDVAGGWEIFQNLLNVCKSIADKYGVSIANIACHSVLQNPAVAAIIVGARLGQSEHIKQNQKVLNLDLDTEDLESIRDAQKQLQPIPGDCGDEYRKPPFLTASGDLSHHLDEFPDTFEPVAINKFRSKVSSGTKWEGLASYSRAVRDGNRIFVSGTTATHGNILIGGDDAASQTHFVIDKIEGAIESLGGSLNDVVRTRVYVNNIEDWEPIARAHGHRFKQIDPANTLVQAGLIGDGYLVEIEAEAMIRT